MLHGSGYKLLSVDVGLGRIVCGGEEGIVWTWNFASALELEQKLRATRARWLEDERKRNPQEMNIKNRGNGQCSVAAEKNQIRGDGNIGHNRRRISRFKKLFRMLMYVYSCNVKMFSSKSMCHSL